MRNSILTARAIQWQWARKKTASSLDAFKLSFSGDFIFTVQRFKELVRIVRLKCVKSSRVNLHELR